ncbi:MAG: hypothetical protein IKR11_08375 [Solobacterium sp.]|nr:hypothetical protein [Solobacterium sp.]
MGWNILYAFFHCVLAVIYQSYWFFTMFVYYAILGLMRGITLRGRNNILKYCGIGMLGLSVVVVCLIYLSITEVRNKTYHLIVILAIAVYTFCLIIHAVIEMIRAHRSENDQIISLRNISFISAIGSVLSLERSMLGTFGNATSSFTAKMEAGTGGTAFVLIVITAILTLAKARKKAQ